MTASQDLAAAPQAGGARITKALVNLALARQAEFADGAQRVYLHLLADLDPALVARSCEVWARRPRGEYAPAMPTAADIRATVTELQRADADAARARALHPMPQSDEDGPRYFCPNCFDETSWWRTFWCQGRGASRSLARPEYAVGSMVECGRAKEHKPHSYVARCECYGTNPVSAGRRRRWRGQGRLVSWDPG